MRSRIHRSAAVLLSLVVLAVGHTLGDPPAARAETAGPPTAEFRTEPLWVSTQGVPDDDTCFRLPAVTSTSEGTLLAFAERRNLSCADSGVFDVVMRRSVDDGRSWSDSEVVLRNAEGARSVGNATVVADSTGPVFLFTTSQPTASTIRPRTPQVQVSTDDGRTWSAPRDLSEEVKPPTGPEDWYATGPGHGIELTRGPHAGRLLVPVTYKTENDIQGARIVYSDDHGTTWRSGASVKYQLQDIPLVEPTIAEDDDGHVTMVARSGPYDDPETSVSDLVQAVSVDGGLSFVGTDPEDADGDGFADDDVEAPFAFTRSTAQAPSIHVSLLRHRYERQGFSRLLLAGPARPKIDNNAKGMFVRSSYDDGRTWQAWDGSEDPVGVEIDPDHAGYSDMVSTRRGIGVLYEAGEVRFRDEIRFTSFEESALGMPAERLG
ncbi:sialidase family protein [Desertihabitans aurantiacus]|uniref:sialidase family protein n=1 Tax=Desertihabitans aurantiacus TaxID=2282477 RepID=UPI000DF7A4B8|nr:sialidase family protein [Desertihabitans aurantiacus]